MKLHYVTVDVFTGAPFGGNPLAVIPDASGMSDQLMQQVAREFNYSESSFVLPSTDPANTCQVRIFTPRRELPFAGHPNVGTAHVLARNGSLGTPVNGRLQARFEEAAGIVEVEVHMGGNRPLKSEIRAPQPLSYHPGPESAAVARGVSLTEADIVSTRHAPTIASAGIPFLLVELTDRDALARARVDSGAFDAATGSSPAVGVHLYTRDTGDDELDLRARMFAPGDSVPEDPATGSANCALAGLLAALDPAADGEWQLRIGQGFEMGRPSHLQLTARKRAGQVEDIRLAGQCADVMEGVMILE